MTSRTTNSDDPSVDFTSFVALSGSEVNISGGTVGVDDLVARSDSQVNISGGVINCSLTTGTGGEINISGGTVSSIALFRGSVNISGGSIEGDGLNAINVIGGVLNISGGSIGTRINAGSDTEVNLFGSEFVLNGVLLDDSLTLGDAFTIVDRDVTLTGLFTDGTSFSFDLNSNDDGSFLDSFDPSATLTVTLGSPVTTILGDVNQDGAVTFADIPSFIEVLQAGTFLDQADANEDGVVDFDDIGPFIEILQAN